jgi:hypothetical protein
MSADGQSILAAKDDWDGSSEFSSDFGATWTSYVRPGPIGGAGVAISSDGRFRLAAASSMLLGSSGPGEPWVPLPSLLPPVRVLTCSWDCGLAYGVASGELYASRATTTPGAAGGLTGAAGSSLELQYVGGGHWTVLTHNGSLVAD